MALELAIYTQETEVLMGKANNFAESYAIAFDAICAVKPGAGRLAQMKCNQLREAIRSALTGAYLQGCAETAAEFQKR